MKLPFNSVVENLDEILDGMDAAEQRPWIKDVMDWASQKCGQDQIEIGLGHKRVKSRRTETSKSRCDLFKDKTASTNADASGTLTMPEIAAKYGVSEAAVKYHRSDLKLAGMRNNHGHGRSSCLFSESSVKKLADKQGWVARLTDAAQLKRLQTKLDSKKCKKKPHQ